MRPLRPLFLVLGVILAAGAACAQQDAPSAPDEQDAVVLPAFKVTAGAVENFGFTTQPVPAHHVLSLNWLLSPRYLPRVNEVYPHTAAAQAGLKPNDVIVGSDGVNFTGMPHTGWRRAWGGFPMPPSKRALLEAGRPAVWVLEVHPEGSDATHAVTLALPSPSPHWGGAHWSPPEGRARERLPEPGPLAERAQTILDNGIWSSLDVYGYLLRQPGLEHDYVGYGWRIAQRRMIVSRQSGHTWIYLYNTDSIYLTTPAAKLVNARWSRPRHFAARGWADVPPAEAEPDFEREVDFWTNHVGRVSARWPLEELPGTPAEYVRGSRVAPPAEPPLPAAFLKLPAPSDADRTLLAEAMGKIRAGQGLWAYVQTTRGTDLKTGRGDETVAVDPSKPDPDDCVLLKKDGRAATAADVERWRADGGGGVPQTLADLPQPENLLRIGDARIASSNAATVTFEVPLRQGGKDFPVDKFQAQVRVNRVARGLEEISVRQREAVKVWGPIKLANAGLDIRFEVIDPAYPPQPVHLKMGGTARALFVLRLSRDVEITRTDFRRVEPYLPPAEPGPPSK